MPPHEIKKTLSLNEARNFIVAMSKLMGEAVQLIQMNLKKVELTKKLVKQDDDEIQKFQERLHFNVRYTTTPKEKTFMSDEVQKKMNELTDVKRKKESLIRELEKQIKENEEERKIIYECASLFGAFLEQNAMIPCNDSFSDYLDMLIKEEEAKEKMIRDDIRIEQLKDDKIAYEEKKKSIITQISSPAHSDGMVIQIDMVYKMKDQLFSLKHNGKALKQALGTVHFSKS